MVMRVFRPLIGLFIATFGFLGFVQAAQSEAHFNWCWDLNKYGPETLLHSQVPSYPRNFAQAGHRNKDGVWTFRLPLEQVWKIYTETPLKKIWKSNTIIYAFSLDPGASKPLDQNQVPDKSTLQVGSRFFLNIHGEPLGLICNLGMGAEVTEIEYQKKIKFEYLDFSPSYGVQVIYFEAVDPETTRVTHMTKYQGKNEFIDSMYMMFHKEAISQLHEAAQKIARDPRLNN